MRHTNFSYEFNLSLCSALILAIIAEVVALLVILPFRFG